MIRRPPRSTLFPYTNALPIYQSDQLRAVLGHRADHDVGTADVNPDDVAHRSPRWRAGRPRPRLISCTNDDPAGSSAVRAPSRDGTTGPRAGPRGHALRAARTRTPAPWTP